MLYVKGEGERPMGWGRAVECCELKVPLLIPKALCSGLTEPRSWMDGGMVGGS